METESKPRSHHRKRRERAQRLLLLEPTDSEGDQDGVDMSPSRGHKERSRSKPRKKKSSGAYEEDIIDGFAIVSFKSVDDLEKYTQGRLTHRSGEKCYETKRNNSLSPARHKHRQIVKKDYKADKVLRRAKKNNSLNEDSSGETTDNLEHVDLLPNKPVCRRFSDVSTRSSSGAGYLCDSESGDERISDASLDIFKPVNHTTLHCKGESGLAITVPPVSTHSETITTATPTTTSTSSDVTVTSSVTTTTTCVSLPGNSVTTTSVTVTTAHIALNTSSSNSHLHHQPHNHHQQQQQYHYHHHHQQQQQHRQSQQHIHQSQQPAEKKYSPHYNHQQRVHNINKDSDAHIVNNVPSVIKRRPPSPPPLTRSSQPSSPLRHRPYPPSLPHSSSVPSLSTSLLSSSTPVSLSSTSVINREVRRHSPPPARSRTPRREDSRERDPYQVLPPSVATSKPFFTPGLPGHGASSLYSPLGPSPTGLPPSLHSGPSHSASFPGSAIPTIPGATIPALHQHHLLNPQSSPVHQQGMFAPPMPLGLPTGPIPGALGGAATSHLPADSLSNPELLRDELNRRFLISQERSPLLGGMPPLLRADIHQHMHQHQHQHQHMHQHTYQGGMPPPAISTPSLVPSSTPNPFEKLPSNPFIRQNLPSRPGIAEPAPRLLSAGKDKPILPQHPRTSSLPGLPGYPSPLPDTLQTGLPGAFQPKGLQGLHPAVGPLFIPGRELDKTTPHLSTPTQNPSSLPSAPKKPGKWCAVHVRIAWEIYHHQQKQAGDKAGLDSKPSIDPLRPPSQLLSGSSLPRPPDMPTSMGSSLLGGARNMFESSPHNILTSSSHLPSTFPRPSPYSIGSSLPLGLGNGLPSGNRDLPGPSLASSSQDWPRHHRTPPNFPSPWPKHGEDREKEQDRERERSMERRREEERERERRIFEQDRHRFSALDDRSRDRDRFRDPDILAKSRSRSRSPMRNGRADSVKSDRSFERRVEERRPEDSMLKVKEERRESLMREDEHVSERERMFKNEFLASNSLRTSEAFLQANMLDRARMMTPAAAFLASERVPPHPSLWNPFDKGPLDFQNHRFNLQREMEQQLLHRFPGPSGIPTGFPMSPFDQERLREEIFLREKRDYIERLPVHERERLFYENSKIPGLRPPEHLHPTIGHGFPHTVSPAMYNHTKRSSPSILPGAPPPLIHSGSGHNHNVRGHNSPAVNKTKGVSPTDSVGESKRDSNSNSTDPDIHSR